MNALEVILDHLLTVLSVENALKIGMTFWKTLLVSLDFLYFNYGQLPELTGKVTVS